MRDFYYKEPVTFANERTPNRVFDMKVEPMRRGGPPSNFQSVR